MPVSGCRYYCHSRAEGMDGLNHWIPAFAGMTTGAAVRHLSGMAKGLSRWRQTHSRLRRHSSAGWNPGEGAGEYRDGRVYRTPISSCRYYCHSRAAGMDGLNHWIPACAGMTAGAAVRHLSGMAKGLSGWRQTHSDLRSYSSESSPTGLLPINDEGCSTFAQAFLGVLEQGREEVVHDAPFAELDFHRHGHAGAEVDLGVPDLDLRLSHPHAG